AFNIIFYNSKNYQLNFLSNQIIIEFALGMLSYFIVKVIKNKYISLFFIFFGISFLIINNKYNVDRLVDYGIPMLSLFLGVVSIDVNKKNSNYNFKVLKLIGDSSYSIYLIHLFTIGVSLLILKNITFNIYFFILFSFLLSVCSGIIFHIIVEKRIINFFRKVNKKLNL
ncbi:acyltransferase family protein, partial [Proteus mirabilis]